jgi:hypothetical protein
MEEWDVNMFGQIVDNSQRRPLLSFLADEQQNATEENTFWRHLE